jgi:hypothetical protein
MNQFWTWAMVHPVMATFLLFIALVVISSIVENITKIFRDISEP